MIYVKVKKTAISTTKKILIRNGQPKILTESTRLLLPLPVPLQLLLAFCSLAYFYGDYAR